MKKFYEKRKMNLMLAMSQEWANLPYCEGVVELAQEAYNKTSPMVWRILQDGIAYAIKKTVGLTFDIDMSFSGVSGGAYEIWLYAPENEEYLMDIKVPVRKQFSLLRAWIKRPGGYCISPECAIQNNVDEPYQGKIKDLISDADLYEAYDWAEDNLLYGEGEEEENEEEENEGEENDPSVERVIDELQNVQTSLALGGDFFFEDLLPIQQEAMQIVLAFYEGGLKLGLKWAEQIKNEKR